MKTKYPRYGKRAKELEQTLTASDRELLDTFLTYCAMTAGKGQVEKHRRNLMYLRDVVEKPLDAISREDAVAFWGLLKRAPYEEHTKIAVQKSVKRFLKWHYKDIELLGMLKIRKNYLVNKKRINKGALFTPEERQQMLRRAEKMRDKALLVLMYETAGRPQEIRDLRWRHINWKEQEAQLFSKKTQRDRALPIIEAMKYLKQWREGWVFVDPQDEDFVFPARIGSSPRRDKPLSVAYINRIIKSLAKKAGISREVNAYLLRHTRLTELSKKGVRGKIHNLFADHIDGSAQEGVYTHLNNDDMKQEVLEKAYGISKLIQSQETHQEERIQRLESKLSEVLEYLKDSKRVMALAMRS